MKTKIFLLIISVLAICSWISPSKQEFLYLKADQLKPLGIDLNENGVFYKNCNPNWKQDHRRYSCMSFYCGKDNYVTTTHYAESEEVVAKNMYERILHDMKSTTNDFYPLLIGNTKGEMSLKNETLPKNMKLFPVAICMSETKLSKRADTVVIWFKPTEALKKALPMNLNFDDFLKVPIQK